MPLNDSLGNGQTQAGTVWFGGEKRIKDFPQRCGIDTAASVSETDLVTFSATVCRDSYATTGRGGLESVDDNIEKSLAQFFTVRPDYRSCRDFFKTQADLPLPGITTNQSYDGFKLFSQRTLLQLSRQRTRHPQKILNYVVKTLGLLDLDFNEFMFWIAGGVVVAQNLGGTAESSRVDCGFHQQAQPPSLPG